jgi:hypothetical protein
MQDYTPYPLFWRLSTAPEEGSVTSAPAAGATSPFGPAGEAGLSPDPHPVPAMLLAGRGQAAPHRA